MTIYTFNVIQYLFNKETCCDDIEYIYNIEIMAENEDLAWEILNSDYYYEEAELVGYTPYIYSI